MGKNKVKKPQMKKTVPAVKKPDVEVTPTQSTVVDIITAVNDLLKKHGATGYLFAVADQSGKILPYASGASIGDVLTLQYVINKEVTRLIDKPSAKEQKSEATAQ